MIIEKESGFESTLALRNKLKKQPTLKNLFLELTTSCNERCVHCGSDCGKFKYESELTVDQYKAFLDQVKADFDISKFMLCITGGEPLLRKDFFEIMSYANQLGYKWGMTSNGTLITKEVAKKLAESGMRTISISIDGLEETHDKFRQTPGGYNKAMEGINNLIELNCFEHIQVTTVVTHQNISELPRLKAIFDNIDIDSWRIINLEPIGRALKHPDLLLTKDDYKYMFNYIRDMRKSAEPVVYGCSHYLGLDFEAEVRDNLYLCGAGTFVASITANGDIIGCLDVERRPEFIQGNILKDNFKDVWFNKYKEFRRDLSDNCYKCYNCSERDRCHGDSFHSWDFDNNRPLVCFKDILF